VSVDIEGVSAGAILPASDRDREMLDPRVMVEMHKERIAPRKALEERFNEAERRRKSGNAP
jgi:hypothetical protein